MILMWGGRGWQGAMMVSTRCTWLLLVMMRFPLLRCRSLLLMLLPPRPAAAAAEARGRGAMLVLQLPSLPPAHQLLPTCLPACLSHVSCLLVLLQRWGRWGPSPAAVALWSFPNRSCPT